MSHPFKAEAEVVNGEVIGVGGDLRALFLRFVEGFGDEDFQLAIDDLSLAQFGYVVAIGSHAVAIEDVAVLLDPEVGHPGFWPAGEEHHADEEFFLRPLVVPHEEHELEIHPGSRGASDHVGPVGKAFHFVDAEGHSEVELLVVGERNGLEESLVDQHVRPGVTSPLGTVSGGGITNLVLRVVENGKGPFPVSRDSFDEFFIPIGMVLGKTVIVILHELELFRRVDFDSVIHNQPVGMEFANLSTIAVDVVVMQAFLKIPGMGFHSDLADRSVGNEVNLPWGNVAISGDISARWTAPLGVFFSVNEGRSEAFGKFGIGNQIDRFCSTGEL